MKKIIAKTKWRTILLDLFLVIIGVLIAFWLSNFQSKQKEKLNRNQLLEQCKLELRGNLMDFHIGEQMYDSIYHSFIEAERNLEQPPLYFRNISMVYDLSIWEMAVDKGIFNAKTVSVINKINSEVSCMRIYGDRQHDCNIHLLLPNLEQPITEFYDPDTKRLREKYYWYISNLGSILSCMKRMNKATTELNELLKEYE